MTRRAPADGLFDRVVDFANLIAAARRCLRGKLERREPALFQARLEHHVLWLQQALAAGAWRPHGYRVVQVHDPKPRTISVAPFADRVVHQALCAVLAPVLEHGYIGDNYASRKGYGQHRAVARFEQFRARWPVVLRADIWRYFASIDHDVLKRALRRRVACERTLALLDCIIDGSNPQVPAARYFDGDELWSPFERRRGLPLGNLTSQLCGNYLLDGLDHYAKEVLRVPGYLRYLDDIALFCRDEAQALRCRDAVARWLDRRRLMLHPDKTRIRASAEPQVFLGFELWPDGRRRLPRENVDRAAGRIASMRAAWRAGRVEPAQVRASLGGWVAHARHADTWHLRSTLFGPGWFQPGAEPARRKAPVARRRVEQQPEERAFGQSQQRRRDESQQQHRLSSHQ